MTFVTAAPLLKRRPSMSPLMGPSQRRGEPSKVTLDVAWASFEKKYIGELIAIEDKARL